MTYSIEQIAKACPQLLESEVRIVFEEMNVNKYSACYTDKDVRRLANQLFPLQHNSNVYRFDGKDQLELATKYLDLAIETMSRLPEEMVTDNVGQTILELKNNYHWLIGELNGQVYGS